MGGAKSMKLLPRLIKRPEEVQSQISADEWGEVARFQKVLDNEIKDKERYDYFEKQKKVKLTLDTQV